MCQIKMLFACRGRNEPTFIDPTKKVILFSARMSKEIALILSEHLSGKKATNFLMLYQCPYSMKSLALAGSNRTKYSSPILWFYRKAIILSCVF